MSIKGLIKGLREFRKNYFCTHQELFQRLSHCQAPEVLFISCCDSRIDPNLLTQTQPGDLFILRNIGNMIPPYGVTHSSEGAAIEYAVQALKVKDIIICGHSDCGAMKGLLQLGKLSEQMPLVYDWLKHYGQTTHRLVEDNYKEYSGESLLKITIEENILTQIQNLETYPVIRFKVVKERSPKDRQDKEAMLRLVVAFAFAMKIHLRGDKLNEQLASLMSESQYFKLKDAKHPPLQIAFWIRDYLQHQHDRNCLNIYQLSA